MRIVLAMLLCFTFGLLTFAGEKEYAVMTVKIEGFDKEKGVVVAEPSPVCKKAKYAFFKDMNMMEMERFVEEIKGKRIVVFIEKCEEIIKVVNFNKEGEKEVF